MSPSPPVRELDRSAAGVDLPDRRRARARAEEFDHGRERLSERCGTWVERASRLFLCLPEQDEKHLGSLAIDQAHGPAEARLRAQRRRELETDEALKQPQALRPRPGLDYLSP